VKEARLIASQSSSCSNAYETELLLSRPPNSQSNIDMVFAFARSKGIDWVCLGLFVAVAVTMSVQLSWSVSLGVPYKSLGEWPVPFPTNTVDSDPSSSRIQGKVQNRSAHPATTEESEDRENQKEQLLSVDEAPSSSPIQWEGRNYSLQPSRRRPIRSPGHVFWCGYPNLFTDSMNMGDLLFPEVNVSMLGKLSTASEMDVLLFPCGGPCELAPSAFPGKILAFNGESFVKPCMKHLKDRTDKVFFVSAIEGELTASTRAMALSMHLGSLPQDWQNKIFRQDHRAVNTKERFLIYAVSNCVVFRELAFVALSRIGPVEYAGRCRGSRAKTGAVNATRAPGSDSNRGWGDNHKFFHSYRFALVMENRKENGYITEKIVNAFLAGAIPIYYGSEEVLDIFNENAFIYVDINDSQPGLDRIAYLESNRTAYDEMFHHPILAHGEQTIEKYFSWSDQVGGGRLKWEIRTMLGFE
jgi:hypothetical protein